MHGLDTKTSGIPCATPYSHRPVQKLLALIGNAGSSQHFPRCTEESRGLVLVPYTGVPDPTVMIQRKEIVASLLLAPW